MKTILLLAICGCSVTASEVQSSGNAGNGCPTGEQPVFDEGGGLECAAAPMWPPEKNGSRELAANCALLDGSYRIRWRTDIVSDLSPAFASTNLLTVAGDSMTLGRQPHNPSWEYPYSLDWVDAARANGWEPGDSDTLEFYVYKDCASGKVRGSYTVNLPYYNRGAPQVVTWTLESTDDQTTP